ncbi:MAG: flagellar basal body rod protein FlgB [Clostridium argentinense]|uniref:Flagellar basal body rod protein FlgB n=2 Tax=Clostridiaceae TaxID=31979 RepID=A0ABR8YQ89_9CLOT|nr:flagellar basal body rod protein FlgB [Clostridium faecium]MBS5825253.1 flagellar basal body rod protein FlgB [Clostridium argentinense]
MSYNLIKKGMDVTIVSNRVIANNISNFNTKDYKRHYIDFDEALNNKISQDLMKKTNDKHLSIKGEELEVKTDTSSSMREDGNNVDVESEMASEAANNLMYEALVKQANTRFNMRSIVIKGGN